MPVYDEEGNVIEGGMTKEEVDKTIKEKLEEVKGTSDEQIEKVKTEIKEEYDGKIKEKDDKLTEIKDELAKMSDKDENVGKLRGLLKTTEKERDELKEALKEGLSEIKKGLSNEKVDEEIQKRTGGDEDKAKLVKFHYDNFKTLPKDAKERKEYLDNACRLAGVPVPGETDGVPGSAAGFGGGAHVVQPQIPGGGKVSDEVKEMAKKNMGVTDEDIKAVENPK